MYTFSILIADLEEFIDFVNLVDLIGLVDFIRDTDYVNFVVGIWIRR